MSKIIRFYVLENGDDCYVAPESRLRDYVLTKKGLSPAVADGKLVKGEPVTRKIWDAEYGSLGKWLCLTLRRASALIERQVNARCRIDHGLVGFQVDEDRLPAARFEEIVESWGHEDLETEQIEELKVPVTEAAFLDLHPNLSTPIDEGLRRHLRPNIVDDPDFFTKLRDRSGRS